MKENATSDVLSHNASIIGSSKKVRHLQMTPQTKESFSSPGAQYRLSLDLVISEEVNIDGKDVVVNGSADIVMGYDSTLISSNLIVVEAKNPHDIFSSAGQLIAYMGKSSCK